MASVDGLVSGLNTGDIIKQLMQLERAPQLRLQSRQTATESAITSLRGLNTKFLSITTLAEAFGAVRAGAPASTKPTDWQLTTASSSDTARVAATAVSGAAAGSLTFNVEQLATASSHLGDTTYAGTDAAFSGSTSLSLTKGGTTTTIDTGDGTLAGTVAAINKAGIGVTASAIQISTGEYKLYLSSTTTGADGAISLSDSVSGAVGLQSVVEGKNAILRVGGVPVERSSNTISDVLQGVTLTLTKADTQTSPGVFAEPPVTVSVTSDSEGVAAKVAALVEAANAARTEAKNLTTSDPIAKTRGRLYGDSGVRSLVDSVRGAVTGADASAAMAGVSTDRYGVISFDKDKFLQALAADPAAVEAALGKDGMAGRLHAAADLASRASTATDGPGLIAGAITNRESQIVNLRSSIERWDNRLERREATLQRQYTTLETALGRVQSQGQWLSGQLANLPKWSS